MAAILGANTSNFAAEPNPLPQLNPFETDALCTPRNVVDELVERRLRELGLKPAKLCSDAVFVRRVFLETTGTLPTAPEAAAFIQSRDPDKRRALIDRLLEREEFADYQAMRWSDALRIKAEFPINLWPNAAQAYHRWVRAALRDNMPYDAFARELLTASGSNFRVPPVNFWRATQNREPVGLAQTVALTFMGTRAERWPSNKLAGLAAFFSQVGYKSTGEWKEEIVFWNPAASNAAPSGVLPNGKTVVFDGQRDPRALFADWLVDPKNPWFTRAVVNRIWAWLFGRGIVHEPDDLRPDNPPSHPDLLARLEVELIAARYDLKQLYRLILNSQTWQRSCIPTSNDPRAEIHFAHYPLRRLDAEVLIDAICRLTGSGEKYTSAIPEPFTVMPADQRAVALPDGSVTSPFLELFGRPPRDTGLFAERNNRITAAQRLHLLNSSHIQRKLEDSPLVRNLGRSGQSPREIIQGVYLAILSRYPTDAELKTVAEHFRAGAGRSREAALDLAWALLNSPEFLFQH
ncbi:MAG: DUF1553 domain-containing protein [Verrucomicrobiales bacterium]|nr:DUF1553 domain-containing protein [Verrucomicrobiales bacterium]